MHCKSQRYDEFRDLQCGNDSTRKFCQERDYRDTSDEAKQKQVAHGEKSCTSRLKYFCGKHEGSPGECGICAGRLWHEIQRLKCSMQVVQSFCDGGKRH
jgi:hypothetical protein